MYFCLVFLSCPTTEHERKRISQIFGSKCQFNHSLEAIDDKRVVMQAPARSGLMFFNYKGNTFDCT